MRIALVVHQFPPDAEAGTEILCLRTAQRLQALGEVVQVFAMQPHVTPGAAVTDAAFEGINTIRIPARRQRRWSFATRLRDEFDNPGAAETLVDRIAAFAPDVIHMHHALHAGLTVLPRLAQIAPLILTATDFHLACPDVTAPAGHALPGAPADDVGAACLAHAMDAEKPRLSHGGLKAWLMRLRLAQAARSTKSLEAIKARRRAARAGLAAASRILAGSPRIAAALAEAGAPDDTLEILPHATPPLNVPSRPIGTPLVAGLLATLAPHKGPQVFLDAIAMIPPATPLRFVLGGPAGADPAFAAAMKGRAAADPRIAWRDPVPNTRFGDLLGELDIAVFPSLWDENRPLTLLGALEAGRYVIVSNVPGLTAEVDAPRQGQAVPTGDSRALADTLIAIAANDAPLRAARLAPPRGGAFDAYVETLRARYATSALR